MLLDVIIENTNRFLENVPKTKRKGYGQFFTTVQTARFMSNLFDFDLSKDEIHILDPGAGTGILSAAVIEKLSNEGYKGQVILTCYETDPLVVPVLEENLNYLKESCGIEYNIVQENYITSQHFYKDALWQEDNDIYDYVIGNPPYKKIAKDAPEALAIPEVCYGAPNLYFLFCAMSIYNLKQGQQMVYIIPRSWTSGAYFDHFRRYVFSECVLTDVHLFESRDKVFDGESVLQETMIVKFRKTTEQPECVHISTSSTSNFEDVEYFDAPYNSVVARNKYVFLVTTPEAANVLSRINALTETLPDLQMPMKTGLIVDFRVRDDLWNTMEEGCYPLIYSSHIKDGKVVWPQGFEDEYIMPSRMSYLQKNANYLIVKRFTSKEEKRRLQCGIYLQQYHPEFDYISTQNKVNFILCESPCLVYGLYVLFNSTLYDKYYRILNGSTQVNSTEVNQMPVPSRTVLESMGRELMHNDLSESNCDRIIDRWIRGGCTLLNASLP